jgi:hypothetical protein
VQAPRSPRRRYCLSIPEHYVKRFAIPPVIFLGCISVLIAVLLLVRPEARFQGVAAFKYLFCGHTIVIRGLDGWLFYKPEIAYVLRPLPALNIQRIKEFDKTLRRLDISLFVVPIPNKIDLYPEKFTRVKAPRPVKKSRKEMIETLKTAGVQVIDLVPAFEKEKESCPPFEPFQTHWTPSGIEIAARVIAQAIDSTVTAKGIVRNVSYDLRDTVVKTFGDLRDRLNGVGKKSVLYPVLVGRVYRCDGVPYRDDKQSSVLILGDSFVDHLRWYNAQLGAHIARNLGAPTRTYFSLLANTDGPCMYSHKPSVFPKNGIAIWAFTSRVLRQEMCKSYHRR